MGIPAGSTSRPMDVLHNLVHAHKSAPFPLDAVIVTSSSLPQLVDEFSDLVVHDLVYLLREFLRLIRQRRNALDYLA